MSQRRDPHTQILRVAERAWMGCAALLVLATAPAGCATTDRPGLNPRRDVPNPRAHLPLSKIEPHLPAPHRPADLAPLSDRAAARVERARALLAEDRYTEASIQLERALRFDPDHPGVHAVLASVHWHADNTVRARTHAEKAIARNPDLAEAHFILGRCAEQRQDEEQALRSYRLALLCTESAADQPVRAQCRFYLGRLLVRQGYSAAGVGMLADFLSWVEQQPDGPVRTQMRALIPEVRRLQSGALQALGRYSEAADALRPLVDGGPLELAIQHARLLGLAGRSVEALAAARSIRETDEPVLNLLFELHAAAGDPSGALDDLQERLRLQPENAALVMAYADALQRLDQVEKAQVELERFLGRRPDATDVRIRLSELHGSREQWLAALRVYAQGLKLDPAAHDTIVERIQAHLQVPGAVRAILAVPRDRWRTAQEAYLSGLLVQWAGHRDDAVRLLQTSLNQVPAFLPARIALAELYIETFRYDDAIAVAMRTEKDEAEDARLERLLGAAFDRLDDVEKALQHYRAALQLDRDNPRTMFELAKLYERSGKRNMAQHTLQLLLEASPQWEDARELLAALHMREGKFDVAFGEIEELKRHATSRTTIARCDSMLDPTLRRDPQARRTALEEAILEGGGDVSTWLAIAETYSEFEPEKVREAYLKAQALAPHDEEVLLGLAHIEQQLLMYEDAARRYEELLRIRPNRHRWRLALIELHELTRAFDAALQISQTMLSSAGLTSEQRHEYRVAHLQSLRRARRDDESIQRLLEWVEGEPDDEEWKRLLAREYNLQDQPQRAVPYLQELYESKRTDWRRLGALVNALIETGQTDRAGAYVLDFLDPDPQSDTGNWLLATLLAETGQLDQAIELIRNHLLRAVNREVFQDLWIARLQLARRHDETTRLTEVLINQVSDMLRSARRQRSPRPSLNAPEDVIYLPNEPFVPEQLHERLERLRRSLAVAMILGGRARDARMMVQSWLDRVSHPAQRVRYLQLLANCYRVQGDEARAVEALEGALLLAPEDITLNNDVAYSWIDSGERLEEAAPMVRFALSRRPRQGAYIDTYGWFNYKKGDLREARKWLLRANQTLRTPDPVVCDHLGDVSWRLGQQEEAVRYWSQAVDLINGLDPAETLGADARRVREMTPLKIDAVRTDQPPPVAPLGGSDREAGDASGGDDGSRNP